MASTIETRAITVPVGKSGNRVVVEPYGNNLVSSWTFERIERGAMSGERVGYRIAADKILRAGIAPEKDHFLLRLAAEGVVARRRNTSENSHAFNYRGFAEGVAAGLDISYYTFNALVASMRANMVYEEPLVKPFVRARFRTAVERFLADHPQKNINLGKDIARIRGFWDGSLRGFYGSISGSPVTIRAALLPYEVAAFATYYFDRTDSDRPLTVLDKIVLEDLLKGKPTRVTAQEISSYTEVLTLNDDAIVAYRHLLLNGSATGVPRDPLDQQWYHQEA